MEIEQKFQELVAVSNTAPEIDVTGLHAVATKARAIKDININNAEQMLEVTAVRKELAEARKATVDFTESAREQSYRIYKGILEVKNTLLEIITPEEDRLKAAEKELKEQQIRESRLESLPAKRERVTAAGIDFADVEILARSDPDFEIEFNSRLGAKLEADRLAAETKLAEERESFEKEKAELDRQKAEAERVERARVEEREKAAEELRLAKEKAERDIQDAEARRLAEERYRADAAKAEAERVERARVEEEADAKYQSFLKDNKYSEATDIIIDGKIYRFVAEFKNK